MDIECFTVPQAADLAARYAGVKGATAAFTAVVLRGGRVFASNGMLGVILQCPEIGAVDAVVEALALKRMVTALPAPKISMADKGKKLLIEGGGSKFHLTLLRDEPPMVEPPDDTAPWVRVSGDSVRAIKVAASLAADTAIGGHALAGVRFTPDWVAAGSASHLCVAWVPKILDTPVTVSPAVWDGLEGEVDVIVATGRFWTRELRTGQIRWCLLFEAAWPDGSVDQVLSAARTGDGRRKVPCDPAKLAELAKRADIVSDGKALTILHVAGAIRITGAEAQGISEFDGMLALDAGGADATGAESARCGLLPATLARVCDAVAAVPGDRRWLSVEENKPIVVWGGKPVVVEALVMPQFISA